MERTGGTAKDCVVVGGDKLPAETGGVQALCAAIDAAARQNAPGASFAVEVRVISRSALAAVVTMGNGRKLPEQKMAMSDRALNRQSIEDFAAAIVLEVGRASGR